MTDWGSAWDRLVVFSGGKDKTSSRQMAAGLRDAVGFEKRFRTGANGEVTCYATKGGMPEVTVTKKFPRIPKELVARFFATPSSKAHAAGYLPTGATDGPVSKWERWPSKTTPPTPGTELVPCAELGSETPGSITWFSDLFKIGGAHVVLSWRGNNLRHGFYGSIEGEDDIADWRDKPSNKSEFRLAADCYGRKSDFTPRIWLSDKIWVNTGVPVWAAGLRKTPDGTYLYVISRRDVYRAKLRPIKIEGGEKRLNDRLHDTDLVMELVVAFGAEISYLSQMPFINASGTKAVLVRSIKAVGSEPLNEGEVAPWNLAELDLDTATVSPVFTNKYTRKTHAVGGSLSANTASVWFAACEVLHKDFILAADYKGDTLVYLRERHRQQLSAGGVEETSIVNWPAANYSSVSNAQILSDSYDIIDAEDSVWLSESVDEVGGMTRSLATSTVDGTATTSSRTESLIADAHTVRISGGVLLAADLRHDLAAVAYTKDEFRTTANYSAASRTTHYSISPDEVWTATRTYALLRKSAEVHRVTHDVTGAGGVTLGGAFPDGTELGLYEYRGLSGFSTTPETASEYEAGPFSFVQDFVDGDTEWVCADVSHLAASPDGTSVYYALSYPTTGSEEGVDVMFFDLADSEGVRTRVVVTSETYAPGSASCLAGAIFYPKILERQ